MAHAGTPDEQIALLTVVAGLWVGWAGVSRIRHKGFPRVPLAGAWALSVLSIAIVVAGLTLPRQFMRPGVPAPTATGARPASTASLTITRPVDGQTVAGDQLEVVMGLEGGRVVDSASTTLTPDTGHIHLSLDGRLVSMTYGLVQIMDLRDLAAGEHTLRAEFVAADHAPFDPRVVARVLFITPDRA